ncbi:MAG: hypothetical protein V1492_01020 [Candidatus Micrarchaeota archaeon]
MSAAKLVLNEEKLRLEKFNTLREDFNKLTKEFNDAAAAFPKAKGVKIASAWHDMKLANKVLDGGAVELMRAYDKLPGALKERYAQDQDIKFAMTIVGRKT